MAIMNGWPAFRQVGMSEAKILQYRLTLYIELSASTMAAIASAMTGMRSAMQAS